MNEQDLKRWLSDFGGGFMYWLKGTIVIDSWHDKEFRRLGGDTDKLARCFEDNCEIDGAIEDYFK